MPCPSWVVRTFLKNAIKNLLGIWASLSKLEYWNFWKKFRDSRRIVLVTLEENAEIKIKSFETEKHPEHSEEASFEEPDQLVDVVPGDPVRGLEQEHGPGVPGQQGADGAAVLARADREVGVTVTPERGPLHQLKFREF